MSGRRQETIRKIEELLQQQQKKRAELVQKIKELEKQQQQRKRAELVRQIRNLKGGRRVRFPSNNKLASVREIPKIGQDPVRSKRKQFTVGVSANEIMKIQKRRFPTANNARKQEQEIRTWYDVYAKYHDRAGMSKHDLMNFALFATMFRHFFVPNKVAYDFQQMYLHSRGRKDFLTKGLEVIHDRQEIFSMPVHVTKTLVWLDKVYDFLETKVLNASRLTEKEWNAYSRLFNTPTIPSLINKENWERVMK